MTIHDRTEHDTERDRLALIAGLHAPQASIAPKYFYDALGCALFSAICELDEYYPTRTERAIFERHRTEIARIVGKGVQFVDLGAGDGVKAEQWFGILSPCRYVAVDFAEPAVALVLDRLQVRYPRLETVGVLADFTRGLTFDADLLPVPTLFFYPGSSIGNFAPGEALRFLRSVHDQCTKRTGSALLIGVDTKKEEARLHAAYDDALGVTAAFNRNILRHVNTIIGSDFDVRRFTHVAYYDPAAARIEMHLEASAHQDVFIGGRVRSFAPGERIATEHSYKYAPEDFDELLRSAGFVNVTSWQHDAGAFAVFCAS
ncbi:MAG: L-histidine N(alpha)-methyltransferase [Casimicrobiaceae bacterium]